MEELSGDNGVYDPKAKKDAKKPEKKEVKKGAKDGKTTGEELKIG
jgi:hypothetical protein